MSEYATDEEYIAAKSELSNALAALDRMSQENAVLYLRSRLGRLNDEQVTLVWGPK